MAVAMAQRELSNPFRLSKSDVTSFERDGFAKLRRVFDAATLERYEPEITAKVIELNTMHLPLAKRDTYSKAFLQVGNLWLNSPLVHEFVFSMRLARIAADLMGVKAVRLYHDQALYKEPGGGITPWHRDQRYWPLSTSKSVTAWVPLQATPTEMGPLTFAAGTHRSMEGRELIIGDESDQALDAFVKDGGYQVEAGPFALGDVSFHSGWTVHRAGINETGSPRRVMTVIYIDANITIAEPVNAEQRADWANVLCNAPVGGNPSGPLNPILYQGD